MHLQEVASAVEVYQTTIIFSEQQHLSTGLDDFQRFLPPYFFFNLGFYELRNLVTKSHQSFANSELW